jgi:hypothetical protein
VVSAAAYADPSLDLPTSLQDAEDRLGIWLSKAGRVVHVERPDGRVFLAVAYEHEERLTPVAWAFADTQVFALEELAEEGVRTGRW